MKTLLTVLLIIHIACGMTALITGGIASLTRKGGKGHRASGKWYFWAMTGVFVTATALGILKGLAFLFMVGFFSYYFVVRGYRVLYLKGLGRTQKAAALDWTISGAAALFGAGLMIWSVSQHLAGNSFWPVPMVFGLISAGYALADFRLYVLGPQTKVHWLVGHITSMGAGYIATWTAFVVTNVKFLPPVLVWLAPGVVGGALIGYSVRKYTKPKTKKAVAVAATLLVVATAQAQPVDSVYSEAYLRRSTSFAWLTLGGDMHVQSGGRFTNAEGRLQRFGTTAQPRFTISGVHFWGHADFYVSVALPVTLGNASTPQHDIALRHRVETGARVYPLKLQTGRLSPYVGVSFRTLSYNQTQKATGLPYAAPDYDKIIFPWQAGFTYTSRKFHFTAGVNYWRQPAVNYYVGPAQTARLELQPFTVNIGLVRYMDTDRNLRTARAARVQNILHSRLKHYRKLNTAYVGIGPSAALPVGRSAYLRRYAPALAQSLPLAVLPDLTAGYHFAAPDVNVGLSYRPIGVRINGYADGFSTTRHSVMIEGYKFLFNWLGFAPYLGGTVAMENLRVRHNGVRTTAWKPAVGLIAGWDIRVTRTGTSLLRTNLRWSPGLHLNVRGEKHRFDDLEFNFIQYVVFLGRKKFYRQQFGR